MDTSVALVQAYLHVNGYFTVAEYPVVEEFRGEHARSVTDLDILAFRFARAGHDVIRGRGRRPLAGRALPPHGFLKEHWDVLRHAPIGDSVLGVLALIEKWGVDARTSPEPVTQQVKRERISGRTLRGQDANPRRTV